MLLALSLALCPQVVPAPERFAPARDTVRQLVEQGLAPAIAVAVREADGITWAEGFGLADREAGRDATPDTIFKLASISKPFTGTLLMRLVERGAVELDAPVNRYLEAPGVAAHRGDAAEITLRRLANHTAGLPTHWSFFYPGSTPPERAVSIARYGFAAWVPGKRTNYSNLAFGILDHVIARAADRPFRACLVAEILDPLGMSHTDLGVRPGCEEHAARGYALDAAGRFVPVADYGFDHDGASAVRSSALDLMRFAALHLGDGEASGVRLLRTETARAMRARHGATAGSDFGVAWSMGKVRGTPVLRHTGGMPGVSTALELYPERGAAVAVLTNCSDRGATQRALAAIQDILLGPAEPVPPRARPAPAPAATEPRVAGTWRGHADHFAGPIAIELALGAEGAPTLRFGKTTPALAQSSIRPDAIRLTFRAPIATTPAFHGTPELELELTPDADGHWRGVLYAVADATFRLPHWVDLAPAD